MTNLKTLKDFGEYNDFKNTDIYNKLKQEVIKWIKSLRNYPNKIGYKKAERYLDNSENWIKLFFNISDLELKDA